MGTMSDLKGPCTVNGVGRREDQPQSHSVTWEGVSHALMECCQAPEEAA